MVEHETDSGHTIGKEFPDQKGITEYTTDLIRQINSSGLSASEKQQAIKNFKGISREQMNNIIDTTGPLLDQLIRNYIECQKE